jgi:2-dehydro-3-deoxyphosphogalactonate aldolase
VAGKFRKDERRMNPAPAWSGRRRKLVAILRGVAPQDAGDVVSALLDAGFEAIEIPLNSPDPFRSIGIARKRAPQTCLIGAGTVLTIGQLDQLHQVGGDLMVSPNVEPAVIRRARELGMVAMPGVFTATEALQAVAAGASALKFFPASVLGPGGINAIRAVLPAGTAVAAVGGVSEADFEKYARAGIDAFGLGSSLFRPGDTAGVVAKRAKAGVAAYDAAFGSGKKG